MLLQRLNRQPVKMENGFNDLFDEIMNFPSSFQSNWNHAIKSPKTNIINTEDGYRLEMEVPGFEKDQISIELKNNSLMVSGSYTTKEESKEDNYSLKEFTANSFSRNFRIPEGIDEKRIKAEMINGILNISLPKSQALIDRENGKTIKIS